MWQHIRGHFIAEDYFVQQISEQVNAYPIAREYPISPALGRVFSSAEEIGVTREVVCTPPGFSDQTPGADDPGLDAAFGAYEWPQPTVG